MIKNKKLEYLKDLLINKEEIPFLELFRLLYRQGIEFSLKHPVYVEIYKMFLSSKGSLYRELMGEGMKFTREYYVKYIEADKEKGIIRKDIDSVILADLVIHLTTNITIDEFLSGDMNHTELLNQIDSLIEIFRKGIE